LVNLRAGKAFIDYYHSDESLKIIAKQVSLSRE